MYNVLFIVLFILYFTSKWEKDENKAKKRFITFMTLFLSIMSGLRNLATGIDTADYYLYYENIQTMSWTTIFTGLKNCFSGEIIDPGFTLFVKIVQVFCPSFYFFNFIVALIVTSAIGLLIYRGVRNLWGYVVGYSYYISLLYWNMPNNLTRQSIAIGFIIFALLLLIQKKRVFACFFLLFAALIHRSSLIGLIPIFFLYIRNIKCIRIVFLSSIILTPIVFIYGRSFVDFLVMVSSSERYLRYLDSSTDARPIAYILEMVFFYLMGIILWKRSLLSDDILRVAYASFALSVIFISMLWIDSDLIRLGMYFSYFGVVYLPYCIGNANTKLRGVILAIVLCLLLGRSLLRPQEYHFYWEKVELSDRYRYDRI